MWYLKQYPSPVSSQRVTPACSPMGQVDKNLQPLLKDVMGLLAVYVGDYADATGIPL